VPPPLATIQTLPSCPAVIVSGPPTLPGTANPVMWPEGVTRTTRFGSPVSTNHRFPSAPAVIAPGLAPGEAIEYSTTPPATGCASGVPTGEGDGEALAEGELAALGEGVRGGGAAPVGPMQPTVKNSTPTARARMPV
jgi:hypothetical protein